MEASSSLALEESARQLYTSHVVDLDFQRVDLQSSHSVKLSRAQSEANRHQAEIYHLRKEMTASSAHALEEQN